MLLANVKNDPGPLGEVISLLSTLKDGWESAVVAQRRRVAQGGA
jgi:flagellin-specific chaperone FliS